MSLDNKTKYKKLSKFECVCHYGVQNGFFFMNSILFELKGDRHVTQELLNESVRYLVKRQPFLWSTVIKDEKGDSYFVAIEKELDFDNVHLIEVDKLEQWREIMEQDLAENFPETEKLWILKLVRDVTSNTYALLFATLHSAFDSNVSYQYARDLLNILGALVDHKECEEMKTTVQIHPDNIEELFAKQNIRKDFKSTIEHPKIEQNEFPEFFNGDYKTNGNGKNLLKFEPFTIDREKASKLLKAAQKFSNGGAKLNSVFITIICLAVKRIYEKYKVVDRNSLFYEIAINVRKNLNLDDHQLPCFVTCLFESLNLDKLDSDTFWQLAEKQSKSLHNLLENIEEIIQLYNDVLKSLEVNEDNTYENQINFCISNLGILKGTYEGCPIKITNQYLVAKVPTNYGMYYSVSTIDEVQHWVLVYYESLMSRDMILQVIAEINHIIDSLIEKI
jgi:hypothetical protein